MRSLLLVFVITFWLMFLGGCTRHARVLVTRDACNLVSNQEIESVQNAAVKEAKSSEHSDGTFRVSECLYTAAEFSKSVSLALIQPDPTQASARTPKDFWKEKFDPYRDEEPKAQSGDDKAEGSAPKKVEGLGDEAYWVANRFGGMLYVLKGESFISIGIGGTDDEGAKLQKSKTLAQKAIQRL